MGARASAPPEPDAWARAPWVDVKTWRLRVVAAQAGVAPPEAAGPPPLPSGAGLAGSADRGRPDVEAAVPQDQRDGAVDADAVEVQGDVGRRSGRAELEPA